MGRKQERIPATLRLLIVDDQPIVRAGLKMLLEADALFRVTVTGESSEAVSIARKKKTDVVIIGAALPDDRAFVEAARLVAIQSPPKVIFLDERVHQLRAHLAIEVPGASYLIRTDSFHSLADAVKRVAAGERIFCDSIQSRIRHGSRGLYLEPTDGGAELITRLTRCEIEVLRLLSLGNSVIECANVLRRSPSTVDNHRSNVMKKLDLHKISQLTRFAMHTGLID